MTTDRISTAEYLSMSYDDKIAMMIDAHERLDLPEDAAYLAQYLAQYRPIIPPAPHLDNETSVDIADTLQSIIVIDTRVVSRVMRMLGYKLYIQGVSQPVWSMRHVESL